MACQDIIVKIEGAIVNNSASVGSGVATSLRAVTVGKTGSGADYETTAANAHLQIQAAIDYAATTGNRKVVEIIGYGADFIYVIGATLVLKAGVSIVGTGYGASTCQLQLAAGFSGDMLITQNFYSEINTNFNSYSTCGKFQIQGITFIGNGTGKTTTYLNFAAFPSTGQVLNNIYVARDTDTGYFWNGSAYVTTGITRSGLHWRAYSNHLVKIYGFQYLIEDCTFYNAGDFALYSEQTNVDTIVFNNYETMEATLKTIRIVGFNLGGINWLGPHDSAWYDVKGHTNQYSSAISGAYVESGDNYNGGGLVFYDVHFWGPIQNGSNLVLKNSSVSGKAYFEAGTQSAVYASGSSMPGLKLTVTNSTTNQIILNNCVKVQLDVEVGYLFAALATVVKMVGSMDRCVINVPMIDINNIGTSAKVFDITGLTSSNLCDFSALIPYATPNAIAPGILATDLSANSKINVVVAGATFGSELQRILKPNFAYTEIKEFGVSAGNVTAGKKFLTESQSTSFVSFETGKACNVKTAKLYITQGPSPATATTIKLQAFVSPSTYTDIVTYTIPISAAAYSAPIVATINNTAIPNDTQIVMDVSQNCPGLGIKANLVSQIL